MLSVALLLEKGALPSFDAGYYQMLNNTIAMIHKNGRGFINKYHNIA